MAGRREKLRRVGIIPEYRGFTPDGLASGDAIDMTVDELEVLRLRLHLAQPQALLEQPLRQRHVLGVRVILELLHGGMGG